MKRYTLVAVLLTVFVLLVALLAACGRPVVSQTGAQQRSGVIPANSGAAPACPGSAPRIQETTGGAWVCDSDRPVTHPTIEAVPATPSAAPEPSVSAPPMARVNCTMLDAQAPAGDPGFYDSCLRCLASHHDWITRVSSWVSSTPGWHCTKRRDNLPY